MPQTVLTHLLPRLRQKGTGEGLVHFNCRKHPLERGFAQFRSALPESKQDGFSSTPNSSLIAIECGNTRTRNHWHSSLTTSPGCVTTLCIQPHYLQQQVNVFVWCKQCRKTTGPAESKWPELFHCRTLQEQQPMQEEVPQVVTVDMWHFAWLWAFNVVWRDYRCSFKHIDGRLAVLAPSFAKQLSWSSRRLAQFLFLECK